MASGHVREHVDILDSRRGSLLAASSGDMLFTQPRRGVWTAVHCVTHGAFEGDAEGDRPRVTAGLLPLSHAFVAAMLVGQI